MLTITLNGNVHALPVSNPISLLDLTHQLHITPEHVIIDLNGTLYKANQFEKAHIKEADQIEIIHFIGGG